MKKKTFPRLFWQLLLLSDNLSFNRNIFLFFCVKMFPFCVKMFPFCIRTTYQITWLTTSLEILTENFVSEPKVANFQITFSFITLHFFLSKHHITSKSRTTQIHQKYQVNTFEIQYKYTSTTKNIYSNTTQIQRCYQTNTFGIQYKYIRNTKQIQNKYTDNVE